MLVRCAVCGGESVDKNAVSTWKQVIGWVHGPKADAMTLRQYTGQYAHDECIKRLKAGQAADQPDLFVEQSPKRGPHQQEFDEATSKIVEEMFDGKE